MSTKANNAASKSDKQQVPSLLKERNYLNFILIVSVLRYYSDKENPIPISTITDLANEISSEAISEETVTRHLNYIIDLENLGASYDPKATSYIEPEDEKSYLTPEKASNLTNIMIAAIGGCVRFEYRNKAKKAAPNSTKDYYFEPLINDAEYELIKGAITSNRYIVDPELSYLVDVMHMLKPQKSKMPSFGSSETNDNTTKLLERLRKIPTRKGASADSCISLGNVNTIYEAIRKKHQLKLTYGVYSDNKGRINLVADDHGERIINPYAMIWSNGQQYLIATDAADAKERIFHFRLDRIYKIEINMITKPATVKTGKNQSESAPCDKPPAKLAKFFKKGKFQAQNFRNTYPQMSFSNDKASVDVKLNCRKRCLAVLVDNFGQSNSNYISGVTIQENDTAKKHSINLPYPDDDGYIISITNVDYNAIKRLCLQMQNDIYVIEPADLRKDIIKELKAKLKAYKDI